MNTALGLLAVLLLTLATGYFVAQEFAFVAADRGVLREQADAGDTSAARALQVTGRLSFMLSGAQLGITVTALLVGFIAEPAIATVIRPGLSAVGVPEAAVPGIAVALAVAVATVIQMVFGELAPKNLGIARPEPMAKFLARSTLIYMRIAGPVIRLFDSAATGLLRRVGVEPVEEIEHGASPEELSRIISESATAGDLPPRLSELLERALEFGDRTAEEIMVPRPRLVLLRDDRPISDLVAAVGEHGHSRYPVLCDVNGDDVVGVTGVRELLRSGLTEGPLKKITRPALLVPDSLPLPVVLERMRAARDDMACVIDEYGGLAGVVTIEDLAEELVGELIDENDPEPAGVVANDDGTWDLPGTLRLDEIERATGLPLPESDDYDTVAGLVLATLGRMAEPGDRVKVTLTMEHDLLEGDGVEEKDAVLTVLSVQRRVPEWVRLALARPGEDDPGAPGDAAGSGSAGQDAGRSESGRPDGAPRNHRNHRDHRDHTAGDDVRRDAGQSDTGREGVPGDGVPRDDTERDGARRDEPVTTASRMAGRGSGAPGYGRGPVGGR
ncbi:CBS domain containing-hemolysin-like protein [Streptosporangium becharense]|uniref:CBS domain containing-hemolysin-like protein n=1 Tax=Streptosporangium becharense TaxID=1816182 RepID=A0A7W9MGJ2_9ACTN|nr:hemolysin family protein [Streptosporangium becharense]MBB2908800.1 CBS domain containing-hemolysin-like protein [Streptosporangium becharense]MBB5820182.1 CBS domain containing-hemolysin-like protein [Streptosporangium becharense]